VMDYANYEKSTWKLMDRKNLEIHGGKNMGNS
jgi:hypothetical protein